MILLFFIYLFFYLSISFFYLLLMSLSLSPVSFFYLSIVHVEIYVYTLMFCGLHLSRSSNSMVSVCSNLTASLFSASCGTPSPPSSVRSVLLSKNLHFPPSVFQPPRLICIPLQMVLPPQLVCAALTKILPFLVVLLRFSSGTLTSRKSCSKMHSVHSLL